MPQEICTVSLSTAFAVVQGPSSAMLIFDWVPVSVM